MKSYIRFLLILSCLATLKCFPQCSDDYSDINNNTFICGSYGDAAGNSNWNWENTDKTDPNYCKMWYARTSSISTKLTAMGSPFVDAATSALDLISQSKDFTKAKGWELLRRDFGCSHVTAYPYFVLYNRFTSLMRIYVYQPETQHTFSGIVVQIETTKNPWPATTSTVDDVAAAPDKFISGNSDGNFGRMAVAVSEEAGLSRWTMAEFSPAFDPYISNAAYTGAGLKFTIFGVLSFDMKAKIKGRSVSEQDPKVYNFNYVPTIPPSSSDGGQTFDFKAQGDKFIKFGKSITDLRSKINKTATTVYNALPNVNVLDNSLPGRVKALAWATQQSTLTDEGFGKFLGSVASFVTGYGNVLNFIGGIVGLFSGGSGNASNPPPMPWFTSYDLLLDGTIQAKTVQQSFIIRVPGTPQTSNDNGTYFNCPLGIINIKNTPQADTVLYDRVYNFDYNGQYVLNTSRRQYISGKIRNDVAVSFYDGAGLDLVSIDAAIVGQVRALGDGSASYDLFEEHINEDPGTYEWWRRYNFTRADLELGRFEILEYDPEKKLHSFQTPFVKLECLKELAFNADARTDFYVRIKAVLKKKNDPSNAPILYVHDYKIDFFQGSMSTAQRNQHNTIYSAGYLPPYANYTQLPTFTSEKVINSIIYNSDLEERADNSVTTLNTVIVPAPRIVTYAAGGMIVLKPGFEARYGSEFRARIINGGWAPTCGTLQVEQYAGPTNCYNTGVTPLVSKHTDAESEVSVPQLKVFPNPASEFLTITNMEGFTSPHVSVFDQTGKQVLDLKFPNNGTTIQINIKQLTSGVYFMTIRDNSKVKTQKFIINR